MKLTETDRTDVRMRVLLATVALNGAEDGKWSEVLTRILESCVVRGKLSGMGEAARVCEDLQIGRPDNPLANSFDGAVRTCAKEIRERAERAE